MRRKQETCDVNEITADQQTRTVCRDWPMYILGVSVERTYGCTDADVHGGVNERLLYRTVIGPKRSLSRSRGPVCPRWLYKASTEPINADSLCLRCLSAGFPNQISGIAGG